MIKEIKLFNIRSISNLSLKINNNLVIIKGLNAAGKTTILECIYFIATSKSFRTKHHLELIQFDKKDASIIIETSKKYQISFVDEKKYYFINDVEKKILEFINSFKTVVFVKDDVNAIKGSLSETRKFFNSLLAMYDYNYLKYFLEYKKFLRSRNNLLKEEKINHKLLNAYDETNSELLYKLFRIKNDFYNKLNNKLKELQDVLDLEYISIKFNEYKTKDDIIFKIIKSRNNDLKYKTTTFGLHREEIKIYINNNDSKAYASEGQIKTAILLIKLALVDLINESGHQVIILLDDLFAELDKDRQCKFLNYLKDNQTFITTTSLKDLPNDLILKAQIIDIERND